MQTNRNIIENQNPYQKQCPAWYAFRAVLTHKKFPCGRDELTSETVLLIRKELGKDVTSRTVRWGVNRVIRGLFKKGLVEIVPEQVLVDIRIGDEGITREPAS